MKLTFLILAIVFSSCSVNKFSNRDLLELPEYKKFVEEHNLKEDLNEFMNKKGQ